METKRGSITAEHGRPYSEESGCSLETACQAVTRQLAGGEGSGTAAFRFLGGSGSSGLSFLQSGRAWTLAGPLLRSQKTTNQQTQAFYPGRDGPVLSELAVPIIASYPQE